MIEWLEAHMGSCVFVKYLHIECPGCGIQRAFIALLKGEWSQSVHQFPALIPYIITLLLLTLQIAFKWKSGGTWVMWSFVVSVTIMIISYAFRLMT